jgi:hypothetical protein
MNIDDKVGMVGIWELPSEDPNTLIIVEGTYLGCASSESLRHSPRAHPDTEPWSNPIAPCSACRWSEFRIFREEISGVPVDKTPYLLHLTGDSRLSGETPRHRIKDMKTGREIVELLTTRRFGKVYLSWAAAQVLAQAAGHDGGALTNAYDSRLVA